MTPNDPYVNARELTLRGVLLGAIITIVFTASNVYLGLKVGLTVASSIPAAVLSMAILKYCSGSNILENNIVQTQSSAAGAISSVIFILPAMIMVGYWQGFPFWQTTLLCISGGLLGVVFTIPLRRVMVVGGDLPYPEGVAAAEILRAGERARTNQAEDIGAKEIVLGSLFAGIASFAANGLRLIHDSTDHWFKIGNVIIRVPMGLSLALLGAGYLIGIVGGIAILIGVIAMWGVVMPYLTITYPMPADADIASYALSLWRTKARYIGVGMIGIAALWTLITLSKPMIEGMRHSLGKKNTESHLITRKEQDLSPKSIMAILLLCTLMIVGILTYFIQTSPISGGMTALLVLVCTILAVGIGFFVSAACGYMAGLVGTSSSPISGVGIIAVVLISLALFAVGSSSGLLDVEGGTGFLTALAIFATSIVFATSVVANDNLQDLKTGQLVHATPWRQELALCIGVIFGSLVISPVLEILYHAYGFTDFMPNEGMDPSKVLAAPQATLMTTIAKGIFSHNLEWTYISIGVGLGVVVIIIDSVLKQRTNGRLAFPALAAGTGLYLPPSVNTPMVVGAILAWFISRQVKKRSSHLSVEEGKEMQLRVERRGTLFASGLIVGESLIGVILAFIVAGSIAVNGSAAPLSLNLYNWDSIAEILGLATFIACMMMFVKRLLQK